ncbi:cytochrome c oxidase assembly protein [Halobacillus halophilus]|uniref:cytochrome c oxidase assembly protein n=1 Tax=Halobacillus halophilus TaxID=1570 RepID=UPI001CD77274|nr:cytochrome c oxidase assembly protein [Halobacillus halophilus]MCA1009576.1 cytochrome c oxidase assembly protein [Halobacillus halophilus]
MSHDQIVNVTTGLSALFLSVGALLIVILYIGAGLSSSRHSRLKAWPWYRYISFTLGIVCAAISVIGPIAAQAMSNFTMHMVSHLLLGMLAPVLLVISAPVTLLLRSLPVRHAKVVTSLLRSYPARIINHPIITSLLNIGGLWILYTTSLYSWMHTNLMVHILVHVHIFAAGYIFSASLIYIDPVPHRLSYIYRSIVLIGALAAHGILSKYIYGHPPAGVGVQEAQTGGKLMYYGGDFIDLIIIVLLCYHWYKNTHPNEALA